MAHELLSPLEFFTLESLVALEQWSAERSANRKKSAARHTSVPKQPSDAVSPRQKENKTDL